MTGSQPAREVWGTRIGLILAAAGNAIGIGNLLRFPGQAAQNGGGAFMIPYVVSLLLFGLPMMWIAWSMGRLGGRWHHGTTPGIFDRASGGRPLFKYLGVIGLALPMAFVLYYTYIEAWCLGYAWFSATGAYLDSSVDLNQFFQEFLGNAVTSRYFSGLGVAVTFLLITLTLNVWVLYRGVTRGIELLAKTAIPLLLLFCVFLAFRVLTLPEMEGSVWDGLNFLWTPNFSALKNPGVWMAAAGQVFFTLSIGFGSLECYGSYLKENDDIALTGLTTASVNEFVEVIFGSCIAIPAAAAYYGVGRIESIAESGTYAIGMVSMPEILRGIGGVQVFGTMWFLLLFFAAFTSSVAVAQPVMAFMQDEARMSRASAAGSLFMLWVLGTFPVVFFYRYGALDELDFWSGTIGLVVFATIEIIIFSWIMGVDAGWKELHRGAHIGIPRPFKFVMKWVTPPLLLLILVGFWLSNPPQLLDPQPTVHHGVVYDESTSGSVLLRGAADAGATSELDEIEQRLADAVTRSGRDLRFVMETTVNPSSPARVSQVFIDPAVGPEDGVARRDLRRRLRSDLLRWVQLQRFYYEPSGGTPARPVEAQIVIEGRYRTLAIWITRIVMLAFTLGFGMMVWAIWHTRRQRGEYHPMVAGGA
jgi:SNF family Na+-dependent transporter